MSRSPVVSIRANPYKLAKLLDGLRIKFPSFEPKSPGKTILAAIDIAVNQVSYGMPLEPTKESQMIVKNWFTKRKKEKETMNEMLKNLTDQRDNGPRSTMTPEEAMAEGNRIEQETISQASEQSISSGNPTNPLTNDVDLGSEKNNVTDFSPLSLKDLSESND